MIVFYELTEKSSGLSTVIEANSIGEVHQRYPHEAEKYKLSITWADPRNTILKNNQRVKGDHGQD